MPKLNPRREQASLLRLEGKTYGEIRNVLGVSKSTLSSWLKNLALSPAAEANIKSKTSEGFVRFAAWNKQRTESIQKENEEIIEKHKKEIQNLSRRDIMLIGASLYWGEGQKNFGKNYYISFSNSDPEMVRIFMKFLKDILGIHRDIIRFSISAHLRVDRMASRKFWASVVDVPIEKIYYYLAVSKASNGKRPRNLLPHGTFQIRVNRRREFFKVRGLVDGIIDAATQPRGLN